MYKYLFINLCLINICFNLDYLTPTYFLNNKNQSTSDIALQTEGFNHLIGIMIEFPIERDEFEDRNDNGYWDENDYLLINNLDENNNKRTPDYHDYNNNGKYDKYLKDGKWYYEDYDNPKTSGLGKFILNDSLWNYNLESFTSRCDNLIIDNFPHDSNYFLNQLTAVKNYYYEISNQLIDFEIHMIDHIYNAQHQMEYYSASDQELGELFSEALICPSIIPLDSIKNG